MTNAFTKLISVPGIEGPVALITLDNGFDHTKPTSFGPGGLLALDTALDEAFAANPAADRRHRQAVHLRRGRGPQGRAVHHHPRAGPRTGPTGPQGVPSPARVHRPDLRVRQRRRPRRRPRGRAAQPLPHRRRQRRRPRPARGDAGPGSRLGRNAVAAQPDRRRRTRSPSASRTRSTTARSSTRRRRSSSASSTSVFGSADFVEQSLAWAAQVLAGDRHPGPPGDRPRRRAGTTPSPAPRPSSKARPRTTRPARCARSNCSSSPAAPTSPTPPRSTPASRPRTRRSPTCS